MRNLKFGVQFLFDNFGVNPYTLLTLALKIISCKHFLYSPANISFSFVSEREICLFSRDAPFIRIRLNRIAGISRKNGHTAQPGSMRRWVVFHYKSIVLWHATGVGKMLLCRQIRPPFSIKFFNSAQSTARQVIF